MLSILVVTAATVVSALVVLIVLIILSVVVSPLAPPPFLSDWPVPDAAAGLQSSETAQTGPAGAARQRPVASPPPITSAAAYPTE